MLLKNGLECKSKNLWRDILHCGTFSGADGCIDLFIGLFLLDSALGKFARESSGMRPENAARSWKNGWSVIWSSGLRNAFSR
jgi:hypothetical protein